jgi:hypothetical protein
MNASLERLGPAGPGLEHRVAALGRRVAARSAATGRRVSLARAAAALAATIVLVMLLTPLGLMALDSFAAVFNLGRTEVHITPAQPGAAVATAPPTVAMAAEGAGVREEMTLDEARARVQFAIPQPASLPGGYRLAGVSTYTYPTLPAWIPQPFLVELAYRDGRAHTTWLRVYAISLGDGANISRLNLEATPIKAVQEVDINGKPGVLLQLGRDGGRVTWQEVLWEQDDRLLSLSADHLTENELLTMARSVR